jgi:hypothetical protein
VSQGLVVPGFIVNAGISIIVRGVRKRAGFNIRCGSAHGEVRLR